ncbi:DegT/DnrJ/EryC1/StrS family aminotransferase [Winogradskyella immobilis]|uniref:DegT/DnrJ/EryC1/StrS family aminotransferase n=1 Tax=Winogradskyella immobilis TaxID=2816852 RepID=A0ABS8EJW6_9FLAO|nr:DegT/DnrJ/EryC1/StrS family aminotransferase [Winogradskyella immobilis]MCC1483494.1 DegT/DnrJ/EryC1/StrS family aminotransferase [Winogradskyella immobilis]MCG0015588.1 DegT/DnrJ/EryC1/StrS family aminotransferase [Winogradskyella immobilis]
MNSNKQNIKLSPSRISGLESKYLLEALETNELSYYGSNVSSVEKMFKSYFNDKEVVTLNSGTSAIHLSLIMAGVKKDDEVICQSFTYCASVNPILYLGAKPIFIDSEPKTWNMCPVFLEKTINERINYGIKPKAIIVVHSYGMPCKINQIISIGEKYNIPIIEDAAEALGSSVNGRKCGTFGKFGIISFNTNKIITASSGGLIICDSISESEEINHLATQAKDSKTHYQHSKVGYNYKMNNINAAIVRAQYSILDENISLKKKIHQFYRDIFLNSEEIELQEEITGDVNSNFWLNCILINNLKNRERLIKVFTDFNIETRPLWKPMHMQPLYKEYKYYGNNVAETLFNKGLCLPSSSSLNIKELDYIKKAINSIV